MTENPNNLAHTLNNLMSPAMMAAERLLEHDDPAVKRAGSMILDSLDKAVAALRAASAKP
jgi:hypothetical protein